MSSNSGNPGYVNYDNMPKRSNAFSRPYNSPVQGTQIPPNLVLVLVLVPVLLLVDVLVLAPVLVLVQVVKKEDIVVNFLNINSNTFTNI